MAFDENPRQERRVEPSREVYCRGEGPLARKRDRRVA